MGRRAVIKGLWPNTPQGRAPMKTNTIKLSHLTNFRRIDVNHDMDSNDYVAGIEARKAGVKPSPDAAPVWQHGFSHENKLQAAAR